MPHVKMARKSTDTDMTPFVDIAFLILSFFIMATKFKPAEPVKVTTPNSVSSDLLKESDAMMITFDRENKVYININAKSDPGKMDEIINGINTSRSIGLSATEMANFKQSPIIGVPFNKLKGLLSLPSAEQEKVAQEGIPVLDSLNNQLIWWVAEANKAFAGKKFLYMIKGDNDTKYPTFEAVINALRKNEIFKYNLITSQEGAPEGTELHKERNK
jgi:biopolymer transport protein ExbD